MTEEQIRQSLKRSISFHRATRGWSQEELAERLGLSVAYTGMLERGERVPATPVLIKLAEVFQISVDALLERLGREESWLQQAAELLLVVPEGSRATVLAMLRGLVSSVDLSSRTRRKSEP